MFSSPSRAHKVKYERRWPLISHAFSCSWEIQFKPADSDKTSHKALVYFKMFHKRVASTMLIALRDIFATSIFLNGLTIRANNVIIDDVEVRYSFNMKWLPPNKDGVVFIRPIDNSLDFKTSRTYINLENLFDGQKALSKT